MTSEEQPSPHRRPQSSVIVVIPLSSDFGSDDAAGICTIATSIWDTEDRRKLTQPEDDGSEDFLFAPTEIQIPLMLTVGRPYVQSLFDAVIESGRVCRVDPGWAINPSADRAPVVCRTAREIDRCFDALTSDIGLPVHDDVYPIHIWGLPRDVEDAVSRLVDAFWTDPDELDLYRAVLNAGVIVASISSFSCDLSMSEAEFARAQECVRTAVRRSGLQVEWQRH